MKKRFIVTLTRSEDQVTMVNGKYKLNASAFNIVNAGTWIARSDNYAMTSNEKVKLGIDFKTPDTFSIKDKTMYRFPKLDLPRQKVDLLKEKHNVKVIRDPNKADIHVISDKLFDSLLDFTWQLSSTFSHFFSVLKTLKDNDHLTDKALEKVKDIISIVGPDSMIRLARNYNYRSHTTLNADKVDRFIDKMDVLWDNEVIDENKDIIIADDNLQSFIDLKSNTAITLYDTDIVSIIDDQLAIIDNTEYDMIQKMITSDDKENRSLALEMLANCNVDKSYDVVTGIFYWEYHWLKDTNNWNSVNVKALRKRLKAYQGGPYTATIYAYNKYINCLVKDNKLTKFAIDKTRVKLYDMVLGELVGSEANVFKVKFENLELKESLIEKITSNE